MTLGIITLSSLAPWIEEVLRGGVAQAFALVSRNSWIYVSEQKKNLFQAQRAKGFLNAAGSGREHHARAPLCSGCTALNWLAGVYLLLFALSQAHSIAAAKYSSALASGIEICAEMFDLCNDCRVFLRADFCFLGRREA